jgi:hypothetical protein
MRTVVSVAALLMLANCSEDNSGMAGDNPLEDAEQARNAGEPPSPSTSFTPDLPPREPDTIPTEPQTPATEN